MLKFRQRYHPECNIDFVAEILATLAQTSLQSRMQETTVRVTFLTFRFERHARREANRADPWCGPD